MRMPRTPGSGRVGVGTILYRRETGVYELVGLDSDDVLHTFALFRRAGPSFEADTALGGLPWPREALEADLVVGRWQVSGVVSAARAVPGARVRIAWTFYARRFALWPYTQFVEPHRNGQYRAVAGLWRRGRRGAAVRWFTRSVAVTVFFGVLTAPLFLLGQVLTLLAALARLGLGRRWSRISASGRRR